MPWDWDKLKQQQDQRKRPDKGNGGGANGGGGGGGTPPPVDELMNRFKNANFPKFTIWLIVLVAGLLFLAVSSFYTVDQKEVGMVQRFGKFVRQTGPGANFKLPFGIETVERVPIFRVFTAEFMDKPGTGGGRYGADSETENQALMLTGDLNVAVVPWIVQYRVDNPFNYLYKVADVEGTLRDLAESTMVLVVGDRSINEVISKRDEIARAAQDLLQKELREAETGILVVTVELKRTNVPAPVQPSFNEVNQAIQEKERLIYQAREERNKVIPTARGEAERTIKAAEGYALDRVARAQGDASRFISVYNEYIKAEDVTKRRLYLETLKDLLPKLGKKYIVDADQKNLLPLLNIGTKDGNKQ